MLFLLFAIQAPPSGASLGGSLQSLVESVQLYEEVLGRPPASLEDLCRKPADAEFWPDGGFWWGPLPKDQWGGDFQLVDREVRPSRGQVSMEVSPAARGRIVPPDDRLRKYYTARIQLRIASGAGRAHWQATHQLPKRPEDFGSPPKDPWGKDYEIVDRGRCVVIRVADEALRYIKVEGDEAGALQEKAYPSLRPEDEKGVAAAIERCTSDDYAERRAAAGELARFGRAILKKVEERLAREKDAFARRWLAELLEGLSAPGHPDAEPGMSWQVHLEGLFYVVGRRATPDENRRCLQNLRQLYQLQVEFGAKFGGADRKAPPKTGPEFWLALTTTDPPLLKAGELPLVCPCAAAEAGKTGCTYRGPVAEIGAMITEGDNDETPIGLCDDEGHGSMAILLLKNGSVEEVQRNSPRFLEALAKTRR